MTAQRTDRLPRRRCACGAVAVVGIVAGVIGRRDYCRDHLGGAMDLIDQIADDLEASL